MPRDMASLLTLMNQSSSRFSLKSREPSMRLEIESFREPETTYDCEDQNIRDGMCITWQDLWVTVSNRRDGTKAVLQGLTGYARPGELLAVMGPSGCGKTTLLDALTGRLSTSTRKSGDILVNGRNQSLAYGTSAYVTQDETLITTLTVREAVHYSAELQLPASMSMAEKRERADATIREMGLQEAMDTTIGSSWGPIGKRLSSGQKRRLSICLEILTLPKLLFLDEPTSGLDSAASYYVMKRIAGLNHRKDGIRRTIVVSVHQPSSEVFQLFDSLCLLSYGKTVYFGPASEANQFFTLAGFPCPILLNPSDHFLKIINKDFGMDVEEGPSTEEAIDILTGSYKSSMYYQEVTRQVAENRKQQGAGGGLRRRLKAEERSKSSLTTQYYALTKRSFVNMYRDAGYYWFRLAIQLITALSLGTLFYDLGYAFESIQARASMMIFISVFSTYIVVGSFPSFGEDMKVFTRERLNGHYGTGAFIVANTISSMPYLLLLAVAPGVVTYYLTRMNGGGGCLLYFLSLAFASMMLAESQMMVIASIIPNFLAGIVVATGVQGVMILAGGMFRSPGRLPKPFWKYPMYYISFHRYLFQGMCKNEFEGQEFQVQFDGGRLMLTGEHVLRDLFEFESYSKWVDLWVLLGMAVFYKLLFVAIIKFNQAVRPRMVALRAVTPKQASQVVVNPA